MPDPRPKLWWLTHFAAPLAILAASGLAFFALGARPEPQRKGEARQKELLVKTVAVQALGDELVLETTGEVVPHAEIVIATEVGGRVLRKHERLRVGEFVERGQLLIEIDPERFDLEVARLTTIRDEAESDLSQIDRDEKNLAGLIELARDSHRLSESDLKRVEDLRKQNVTTAADYAVVRKSELTSRDALQRLENELRDIDSRRTRLTLARDLASIQLKQAELNRQCAKIMSPVSGVVTSAPVEDHAVLQAGQQIAAIEDTSQVEVHCHLTVDEMYWVWNHALNDEPIHHTPNRFTSPAHSRQREFALLVAGDDFPLSLPPEPDRDVRSSPRDEARSMPAIPADVVFELGGEEFAWTGSLARIDGAGLDIESRTVPCRIVVERPTRDTSQRGGPQTLMRGMFVSCRIHTRPRRQLLTVPEIGVRPGNEVWLMRDGQLHVEPVRIVRVSDGVAVIDGLSAGVHAGDRLITTPVPDARDGLPVTEADKGSRKAAKAQRGGDE
ncbi:MAG: HlyD family efflux transporter periplasmic adaptor subunit [Planctomycetaceae bacterium]|nr:HlyD family efflux transporter periplasmic adaptor subunit [Planctomycetaceae bacterium]